MPTSGQLDPAIKERLGVLTKATGCSKADHLRELILAIAAILLGKKKAAPVERPVTGNLRWRDQAVTSDCCPQLPMDVALPC